MSFAAAPATGCACLWPCAPITAQHGPDTAQSAAAFEPLPKERGRTPQAAKARWGHCKTQCAGQLKLRHLRFFMAGSDVEKIYTLFALRPKKDAKPLI
jgi:hypothetical protein